MIECQISFLMDALHWSSVAKQIDEGGETMKGNEKCCQEKPYRRNKGLIGNRSTCVKYSFPLTTKVIVVVSHREMTSEGSRVLCEERECSQSIKTKMRLIKRDGKDEL